MFNKESLPRNFAMLRRCTVTWQPWDAWLCVVIAQMCMLAILQHFLSTLLNTAIYRCDGKTSSWLAAVLTFQVCLAALLKRSVWLAAVLETPTSAAVLNVPSGLGDKSHLEGSKISGFKAVLVSMDGANG